jgi:hypothetical protein
MNRPAMVVLASLASFIMGAGIMGATQQLPTTTRREPQFENDHVRVWKSIIQPNQPLALHRHDHGRALVALVGGRLDVVDGTGKVLDTYDWKSGRAYWLPADPEGQMHADVNHGASRSKSSSLSSNRPIENRSRHPVASSLTVSLTATTSPEHALLRRGLGRGRQKLRKRKVLG